MCQRVTHLSTVLASVRKSLAPKPKFTFHQTRKNVISGIGGTLPSNPSSAASLPKSTVSCEAQNLAIAGRSNVHIQLSLSQSRATMPSLLLSSLGACVVSFPQSNCFSGSTLQDISDSLLLLGNTVNGPVHLTHITNTTIVLSCQQFRIHAGKNVDIYLNCSSRPVIEDCENIRFAPYGLAEGNLWNKVGDFKWLRQEASPHWSVLPAKYRIGSRVLKRLY